MSKDAKPVTIIMVEDDQGHARLIEKNIRRAGVNNELIAFVDGLRAKFGVTTNEPLLKRFTGAADQR